MRYREGEIPPEQLAVNASNDMLLLTAVLGVVIGIVLAVMGKKGKQLWMLVWGIGLVFCSVYLGISIAFDWKPFGVF